METILVIWENVPESTDIYLLEDLDKETADKVKAAHAVYVNAVGDDDPAIWLSDFLADKIKRGGLEPLQLHGPVTVVLSGMLM